MRSDYAHIEIDTSKMSALAHRNMKLYVVKWSLILGSSRQVQPALPTRREDRAFCFCRRASRLLAIAFS
jgi:hypothetical protein